MIVNDRLNFVELSAFPKEKSDFVRRYCGVATVCVDTIGASIQISGIPESLCVDDREMIVRYFLQYVSIYFRGRVIGMCDNMIPDDLKQEIYDLYRDVGFHEKEGLMVRSNE